MSTRHALEIGDPCKFESDFEFECNISVLVSVLIKMEKF